MESVKQVVKNIFALYCKHWSQVASFCSKTQLTAFKVFRKRTWNLLNLTAFNTGLPKCSSVTRIQYRAAGRGRGRYSVTSVHSPVIQMNSQASVLQASESVGLVLVMQYISCTSSSLWSRQGTGLLLWPEPHVLLHCNQKEPRGDHIFHSNCSSFSHF